MKRLALFLDGTWNKVESRTNVALLAERVAKRDGAIEQLCHYQPGVGTRWYDALRGGALGYGLSANVLEAYDWILKSYEDGDEIFIFGFSRGAFTARSVAGLIARCGLLHRDAAIDSKTLYDRYERPENTRPIYKLEFITKYPELVDKGEPLLTEDERTLLASSRRVRIKLIGVWDTVGALGVPFGDIPGLSRKTFLFHNTRLSNIYDFAYQALAIDEHRQAFEPALWSRFVPDAPDPPPPIPRREPIVEQRWFIGAHADVGGGNPTPLPEIAAAWLAEKARYAGLITRDSTVATPKAFRGVITDSFAKFAFGLYKLLKGGKEFDRTIQTTRVHNETHAEKNGRKTTGWVETVNETIDGSVFERFRADPGYRPPGLISWAKQAGVDPGALHGAVECLNARPVVTRIESGAPAASQS